ncbi:MAG TPA: hypothetical protein VJI75_01620 [Candidatus Nanoarchaeia archaeon]|nr:hypothetical protein [Candidatus Nanoarchaeia archaeon]
MAKKRENINIILLALIIMIIPSILSGCQPVGEAFSYSAPTTDIPIINGAFSNTITITVTGQTAVFKKAFVRVKNDQGSMISKGSVLLTGGDSLANNPSWKRGTMTFTITQAQTMPGSDGKVYYRLRICDPKTVGSGWQCRWEEGSFTVTGETPPPTISCGDGTCNADETPQTCSADCKPATTCETASCEKEFKPGLKCKEVIELPVNGCTSNNASTANTCHYSSGKFYFCRALIPATSTPPVPTTLQWMQLKPKNFSNWKWVEAVPDTSQCGGYPRAWNGNDKASQCDSVIFNGNRIGGKFASNINSLRCVDNQWIDWRAANMCDYKVADGLTNVKLGYSNACAIDNGVLKCWGNDIYNYVGSPTISMSAELKDAYRTSDGILPSNIPLLPAGKTVRDVVSNPIGGNCVLMTNNEAWCWGKSLLSGINVKVSSKDYSAPSNLLLGFGPQTNIKDLAFIVNWVGCILRPEGGVECFGASHCRFEADEGTANGDGFYGCPESDLFTQFMSKNVKPRSPETGELMFPDADTPEKIQNAMKSCYQGYMVGLAGDIDGLKAAAAYNATAHDYWPPCNVACKDNLCGNIKPLKVHDIGDVQGNNKQGLTEVQSIVGSFSTFCALKGGKVACWGITEKSGETSDSGYTGELGDNKGKVKGTYESYFTPHYVKDANNNDITGITMIAAGISHFCALKNQNNEGEIYCWGANRYGQIGDGTTAIARPYATKIASNGDKYTFVTAGAQSSCAIKTDKTAVCWGHNGYGQLGTGEGNPKPYATDFYNQRPTTVAAIDTTQDEIKTKSIRPLQGVTSISIAKGNSYNACFTLDNGNVACAGAFDMLGIGIRMNAKSSSLNELPNLPDWYLYYRNIPALVREEK